jgi:hypothetical protein
LAANLSKAEAEAQRLREWQDVSKRMADDKQQEVAKELQASKSQAAEQQAAAAGERKTCLPEAAGALTRPRRRLPQKGPLLTLPAATWLPPRCTFSALSAGCFCAAGELSALQERLAARDSQLKSLQQETSLLQMHLREAQRVQGAAAEAQAAANTALDRQDAELRVLQQQLKDAKVRPCVC